MPIALDAVKPAYDVIVVGAGLAGLTAANRLAASGRSVLLLEQHRMIGGCATWFRRGEHIFDVALHAFPAGMAKAFRKYWSKEIADRVMPLRRVRFENPQFSLDTDFSADDFKRLLVKEFGVAPGTAADFFDACRSLNFYDDRALKTRDLFDRFFPGRRDIVRLLLETVTYATGTNLDDPALCYGIVFSNFMRDGTYTFRGGTDGLLSAMTGELERNGVDIALSARVDAIAARGGRAAGVRARGREIASRAVVSNANLKSTLFDLVGAENLPDGLEAAGRQARLSVSVAQVYLGLSAGTPIPEELDLLFLSGEAAYDAAAYRKYPPTCRSYSFYHPRHIRPDHGRAAIVASMCSNFSDWDGLCPDAYRARKREMIEDVVSELERRHPGISERIDHREAATPRTLMRYTGHWDGASFGTKFEGFELSEALPKTIPGLYHAGSCGIIMSGWLGAVNYGALVAGQVDSILGDFPLRAAPGS